MKTSKRYASFEAEFPDAYALKAILSTIANDSTEITLRLLKGKNALYIREMDPAHISMTDVEIPGSYLTRLRTRVSHKEVSTSFITDEVIPFLKGVTRRRMDPVVVSLKKERFTIEMGGETIDVPTLPNGHRMLKMPKVQFTAEATLPLQIVRDFLLRMKRVNDEKFVLEAKRGAANGGLTFSAESDNGARARFHLPIGDPNLLTFTVQKPSRAVYKREYLFDQVKGLGQVAHVVRLSFATDNPLKAEVGIPGIGYTFWLAPRIEDNNGK